jgi:YegS/Rv2252/BmrU family lipid kinase
MREMSKNGKFTQAKLIVNPGAGNPAESQANLQLAVRSLQEHGIKVDVAFAKPKAEAIPIVKQAVKDGYKLIIAMGGDGTIEAALRGVVGSKARLGIIRAGSENNLAKSLGIPEKIEDACNLIASNSRRKLDMGQIKMKGQKKFYFFELVAIGLVSALYHEANDIKEGRLSRIKDAALTLLQEETRPTVHLTLDDESKIEVETMLVVVSNTPMFGKGFLVAPNASLDDGLLEVSIYPDFSKTELLAYYAKIMNEGYSENDKVQRFRARKVEVKTSPKLDILADGITLGQGKVEIKSRQAAVTVIAPEPSTETLTKKDELAEVPAPVYPSEEKAVLEEISS